MAIDKSLKQHYEMQGGVRNYLGKQKMVKAPKKWQSSPDHPETELAYITPEEKNILIKLNLYDSMNGKANKGPSGLPSLQGGGWGSEDKGGDRGHTSGGGQDHPNRGWQTYVAPAPAPAPAPVHDYEYEAYHPQAQTYSDSQPDTAKVPHGGDWEEGWLDRALKTGAEERAIKEFDPGFREDTEKFL